MGLVFTALGNHEPTARKSAATSCGRTLIHFASNSASHFYQSLFVLKRRVGIGALQAVGQFERITVGNVRARYGTITILFPGVLRSHASAISLRCIFSMSIASFFSRTHSQTCWTASRSTSGGGATIPVISNPDVRNASE